jgi:hypothetical protein
VPRQWPRLPHGAETYSVTALRDWECLYRGKAKRIDRRKEPISPQLHEGRIVHDAAAAYIRSCCHQGVETDLSAIPALVRQVFFDPAADEPHSLPAERVVEIESVLQRWAEHTRIDAEHTAAVEEVWAPPVRSLQPAPYFYAILDHLLLAGDEAIIRDYKSDRHLRSEAEVQGDLQVWSYCWAVAQQFPHVKHFRVEMDFLRHGVVREAEFGLGVVEATEELLAQRITQIRGFRQRRDFPAIACDQCQWCGFQGECPILRAEADPTTIRDADDAAAAAAALHVLEARRTKLRDLLAAYTAEAGPVQVGSLAYGHHIAHGVTIDDVREAVRILEAEGHGAVAWDALRFDSQKLSRILRNPDIGPEIEHLAVDTSHSSFRAVKPGAAEEVPA